MSNDIATTERLRIRKWRADDVDAILAVYGDAEAMRWVGDGRPLQRADCLFWIDKNAANYRSRGYGMYAVEHREDRRVVGCCGLVHPDGQVEPELKYAFLREHWGKGYAQEAARALLSYGSTHHALGLVIATVAPENRASLRVLEKIGMRVVEERTDDAGEREILLHWRPTASQ
ncbi:GNAT family N-acetyltransferase [Devosia aquimaris]|uniref:GNAT family N-acetyltransferase n=1 Tax=Devosia aquimaris TaxID=2866214 RepID=UPI001CD09A52|nr:GNAT family N-acetyltransferase [Devosia sp. CJK-A8-3]